MVSAVHGTGAGLAKEKAAVNTLFSGDKERNWTAVEIDFTFKDRLNIDVGNSLGRAGGQCGADSPAHICSVASISTLAIDVAQLKFLGATVDDFRACCDAVPFWCAQ